MSRGRASGAAWVRLPEAKLGSGHRRALRNLKGAYVPGKYWIYWGRRRVGKWAENSGSAVSEPTLPAQSVAFKTSPGGGDAAPPWPPPLPKSQSMNGPDGPVAVGFGEAWQQVGTLFRESRGGCQ